MKSRVVIIMGVSGSGKSTIGEMLSARTGGAWHDGDDFHPEENVEKMRRGEPLTDEDRVAWFEALSELIRQRRGLNEWTFIACSALKRRYRDTLREADPGLRFLNLQGRYGTIQARLDLRQGHYMPATLLESQFHAMEEPAPDEEGVITVPIEGTPEEIADDAARQLGL